MRTVAFMIFAALASGALIVLALPPCGYWPLGWIALAPVFLATRNTRLICGVICAISATMVAAYISANGWFYRQGSPDGNPTWIYMGCTLFGFVFAVVAGISSELKNRSAKTFLVVSAIAIFLDLSLFFVLPATFALSQGTSRPMLLLASFTGIWGISFLLWAYNLLLAEAVAQRGSWLKCAAALPLFSILGFVDFAPQYRDRIGVGVIQSGSNVLSMYRKLDQAALLSSKADKFGFVVWPEFSGLSFVRNGNLRKLKDLGRLAGSPAFVTSYQDILRPLPHNTATLFSEAGASQSYFKRKLFGNEKFMHTPGDRPVAVPFAGTEVGFNICFDSCYPSIIRDTVNEGAEIIALPTIDPDAPYGWFAAQHAAFTPIRAAENGVSIVRADGIAFSTIADPDGRILAQLSEVADEQVTAAVPTRGHWTLYRWAGDWFLYACGAWLLYVFTGCALKRLRPRGLGRKQAEPRFPD